MTGPTATLFRVRSRKLLDLDRCCMFSAQNVRSVYMRARTRPGISIDSSPHWFLLLFDHDKRRVPTRGLEYV